MIYTEQTKKALNLCYKAHAGQVDKGGMPYVFHPVHLAEQMKDELTTVVALLHDVVEDTEYTFSDLEAMGFAPEAIGALKLLTHDPEVPYQEYVEKLSLNPIARMVKMADLTHNLDKTRVDADQRSQERAVKYAKALSTLRKAEPKPKDYSLPGCWPTDEACAKLNRLENRKYRDKIRGSLVAGAAGDALGYEVEFVSGDRILNQFGKGGIQRYVTHGGLAQISDDTQMTLYTAVGLLYGKTRTRLRGIGAPMQDYIYYAYLDWLETQGGKVNENKVAWLNNVEELYSCRAPGNTCLSALCSGQMGSVRQPINNSKGCGGVMRVAPIGLFFKNVGEQNRILEIMRLGGEAAAITHGHPLGYIPAAALVHIVNRIVYGGCKYGILPSQILRECKELLVQAYGENPDTAHMNELIDLAAVLSGNDAPDMENIHAIGGGWVGDEALAIAVYCWLRYPADFDKALIASVNHSGDSDSTGAILGNVLGAVFGYEAIGEKWKRNLELRGVILEIADDLCDDCQMSEYGSYTDERWLDKYVRHNYTPDCVHG